MADSRGKRSSATRDRILDAVERLFAERGYDGASLRALAAAADAPLALLSYHFGNKHDLYRAVWARRMAQVDFQGAFVVPGTPRASAKHQLKAVVEHFFAPLAAMADAPAFAQFLQILGQELHDDRQHERGLVEEFLGGQANVFLGALQAVLPGLSRTQAAVGLRATIGAARALFLEPQSTLRLSGGEAQPEVLRETRSGTVDFLVAGWIAMAERNAS